MRWCSSERERSSEDYASGFEFQKRSGKVHFWVPRNFDLLPTQRSDRGSWTGNRGFTRHPWWRGPREPPLPRAVRYGEVISLFIDGIPRNASWFALKKIFSRVGVVADFYISKKPRKNRAKFFGFVRYYHIQEAKQAVGLFDGLFVLGSKIRVSMARYKKNGTPTNMTHWAKEEVMVVHRHIPYHSIARRFADVAISKKRQSDEVNYKPPVLLSPQQPENKELPIKPNQEEAVEEMVEGVTVCACKKDSEKETLEVSPLAVVVMENTPEDSGSNVQKSQISAASSKPAAPKVSAGSSQSQRGVASMASPIKRSRRMLQNHRDIANFLGFYTKNPLPEVQTQTDIRCR
ncbi:unnamed protein product [Amaranthus hypochondriacus]